MFRFPINSELRRSTTILPGQETLIPKDVMDYLHDVSLYASDAPDHLGTAQVFHEVVAAVLSNGSVRKTYGTERAHEKATLNDIRRFIPR